MYLLLTTYLWISANATDSSGIPAPTPAMQLRNTCTSSCLLARAAPSPLCSVLRNVCTSFGLNIWTSKYQHLQVAEVQTRAAHDASVLLGNLPRLQYLKSPSSVCLCMARTVNSSARLKCTPRWTEAWLAWQICLQLSQSEITKTIYVQYMSVGLGF